MDLLATIQDLKNEATIAAVLSAALAKSALPEDSSARETGISMLREELANNRPKEAVATMAALMLSDADSVIAGLRRGGALRASRYGYRAATVRKVVKAALVLSPYVGISSTAHRYLESVLALTTISPYARQLRRSISARIHSRRLRLLKTLLVVVNLRFSLGRAADRESSPESLDYWTIEEIAEGYSLLTSFVREEGGISPYMWRLTDEHIASPYQNVYQSLLVDAMKLKQFADAEIMIDGLPYVAIVQGNKVSIAAEDAAVEKSIRLGYIQTDVQSILRTMELRREGEEQGLRIRTIEEFVRQAFDAGLGNFVGIREEPIERLVFAIPPDPATRDYLLHSGRFLEEMAMINSAGIDGFYAGDNVEQLAVTERLTVLDIAKVQRLFMIIDLVFRMKFETFPDGERRHGLIARSAIPVMKREQLLTTLKFVLPDDRAEEVLDFLTLSDKENFIDLQYRPFVESDGWYAIAPAVVGKSNLIRNIVTANRLRTAENTRDDPMQRAVSEALQEAGFEVRTNITMNIDGRRETDIFCRRDDQIFVFECKNSYHPCSPHELRTTYEHLIKAQRQLDIRRAWLQRPGNQEELHRALGWRQGPVDKIHTGIITANRAFTGYRMGAHPVRQAHEFINLLRTGVARRNDGASIRFWRAPVFQIDDLVDYLEGESIVRAQMEALQPVTWSFQIGGSELAFESYMMDMRDSVRILTEMFPSQVEVRD